VVFTSTAFAVFFAVVLLGLAVIRGRRPRQLLLLAASAYFYAYWKPAYIFVLAAPAIIDYILAIRIEDSTDRIVRKRWLILSLVTNLGLLAYFKYTNFLIDNLAALAGREIGHLTIILPIGISFFTFKTLSYTIDVYRKEIKACRDIWQYTMFVGFFPELVAGPIVRASVFLPQMARSLRPSWPRAMLGAQVMLLGFTKKVLVADRLSVFVDPVFARVSLYSPLTVFCAVIAYSLQIYCDFSGYSDIAIGAAKIIGFDLPENFNMPYLSTSVVEFWRRWHITLSNWLRDYLYFSLPGIRKHPLNKYRNLVITMFLGGLWHGASWTFVCWGLLHGIGLVVNHWWEDRRRRKRLPRRSEWWIRGAAWLCTYAFLCLTWVLFRAPSFSVAVAVLRKLTALDRGGVTWFYSPLFMLIPLVVIAHALGVLAVRRAAGSSPRRITPPAWASRLYAINRGRFALQPSKVAGIYVVLPWPSFTGGFVLTSWVLILYLFGALNTSPFIYFQF
jgi:alginate O-acetyltransferase complex protein AlgI